MNIRILAASALAFATIVPAANAATVHREHTNAARTHDTDRCIHGELLLGTAECKISGASFKVQNEPGVVKVAPSEIDRGTGGSGDPISVGPGETHGDLNNESRSKFGSWNWQQP